MKVAGWSWADVYDLRLGAALGSGGRERRRWRTSTTRLLATDFGLDEWLCCCHVDGLDNRIWRFWVVPQWRGGVRRTDVCTLYSLRPRQRPKDCRVRKSQQWMNIRGVSVERCYQVSVPLEGAGGNEANDGQNDSKLVGGEWVGMEEAVQRIASTES